MKFLELRFETTRAGGGWIEKFDDEAVIDTSGMSGWYRIKITAPGANLEKVAVEASDRMGRSLTFEALCQPAQFRSHIYISSEIERVTVRVKRLADVAPRSRIALRRLTLIEYLWKSLGRGLLANTGAFLGYFLRPQDAFILVHSFPAPAMTADAYKQWIAEREPEVTKELLQPVGSGEFPEVCILMTVCDPQPVYLRKALDSVMGQTYGKWRLSIADDASVNPQIRDMLKAYASRDSRISLSLRDVRGGISAATNDAFRHCRSPFFACFDHDDLLAAHAIEAAAAHYRANPSCKLLFSDEDKIDENDRRFAPYFKPRRFSPELFFSYNYVNHLTVHTADLVRELGGWRSAFDGAQDYDLILRLVRKHGFSGIRHVPLVLYHWRAIAGSAALDVSYKSYAIDRGREALQDFFAGRDVEVSIAANTMYRVRYRLPDPPPRVSVLVPFRDKPALLRKVTDSILNRTRYRNLELVLIDNGSTDPETLQLMAELSRDNSVRVVVDRGQFNYSRLNNRGVLEATGEFVCLLNNDIEVGSDGDWLADMVGYASQEGIGCVGAKLCYPSGSIQHAGVVLGMGGVAGHAFLNHQPDDPGYFGRLAVASNYSAVTGACMVVRRETYLRVNGLDENLAIAFNDIDFCIKVQRLGLRNVFTPFAELIHWESASRGAENTPEKMARFGIECDLMKRRHGDVLYDDPCYSPYLTLDESDFSIDPRRRQAEREAS